MTPLPETCIRGPELADPALIGAEIRAADSAALTAYQQGIHLLLTARTLLDAQSRLRELEQARAFLLGQLKTLEQQHPSQFAAALAAYDRTTRPAPPSTETLACDPLEQAEMAASDSRHLAGS
jgi:hypothetical protein